MAQISVRELSAALKLKKAGIYYYFADKDEAIIECAEEAAKRLEYNLIVPALKEIHDPDRMIARLLERADEMAPTMKFFAQVCADSRYQEKMKPTLDRLAERYDHYAGIIAKRLKTEKEEIESYVYMMITAMTNYMIFGERAFVVPQINIVKEIIKSLTHAPDNID